MALFIVVSGQKWGYKHSSNYFSSFYRLSKFFCFHKVLPLLLLFASKNDFKDFRLTVGNVFVRFWPGMALKNYKFSFLSVYRLAKSFYFYKLMFYFHKIMVSKVFCLTVGIIYRCFRPEVTVEEFIKLFSSFYRLWKFFCFHKFLLLLRRFCK